MTADKGDMPDALWSGHHAEWRDPGQIASHWKDAAETDPALLRHTVRGRFWEAVEASGATLLVSREYEHLLMALTVSAGRPRVTFMRMPHPSGIAVDANKGVVHVASTRNPNQLFELAPVTGVLRRRDVAAAAPEERPLVPTRTRFYPGCLYMHDLALVGGVLHANAVGQNAVVRLADDATAERVWWPHCIEGRGGPQFGRNEIQLNSIAAGPTLRESFFSASAERITSRRPGHRNFPVDGRGVIFSGATRGPIARGLTRPHSARLHAGRIWVDDSGYGRVGFVEDGRFRSVVSLPGWTRGLFFAGRVAFAATSRVLPRFRQYAPGLDVEASVCGLHAFDTASGRVLGSLRWPAGNQVFAVAGIDRRITGGFPFTASRRGRERVTRLFYLFQVRPDGTKRRRAR